MAAACLGVACAAVASLNWLNAGVSNASATFTTLQQCAAFSECNRDPVWTCWNSRDYVYAGPVINGSGALTVSSVVE
jgi:hypothetical protein